MQEDAEVMNFGAAGVSSGDGCSLAAGSHIGGYIHQYGDYEEKDNRAQQTSGDELRGGHVISVSVVPRARGRAAGGLD
jgi:hypothetical protein